MPGFADAMLEVCRAEDVDAVLPQSSFDLLGLAEAKDRFEGIAVLVSSPEAIHRSNDKAETYAMLDRIGVRGPAWRRVSRRRGRGRRGARARLPGRRRLHEAGLLVRLARVPGALGLGRPARAAALEPARASRRRSAWRICSTCSATTRPSCS